MTDPNAEITSCYSSVGHKSGRGLAAAHLTATSRETRWTQAVEAVNFVIATAAIEAGSAGALVHVPVTVLAGETQGTHTLITVQQVLKEVMTQ